MTTEAVISMPLPGGLIGAQATLMLMLGVLAIAVAASYGCCALCRRSGEGMTARIVAVVAQVMIAVGAGRVLLGLAAAPGWMFTAGLGLVAGMVALTIAILVVSGKSAGTARRAAVLAAAQVTGAPHTGNQRSSSASIGSSRPSAA